MIRIVTLAELDPEALAFATKRLYAAFGVGVESAGQARMPADASDGDAFFADRVVTQARVVKSFSDDKVLYFTNAPLALPAGPMGAGPVFGFAQYGGERAVVTSHGLSGMPLAEGLAKRATHHVGHLFDLHHCFDPRCAMYPEWAPAFAQFPDVALCPFCREKSEHKIRLAGS